MWIKYKLNDQFRVNIAEFAVEADHDKVAIHRIGIQGGDRSSRPDIYARSAAVELVRQIATRALTRQERVELITELAQSLVPLVKEDT